MKRARKCLMALVVMLLVGVSVGEARGAASVELIDQSTTDGPAATFEFLNFSDGTDDLSTMVGSGFVPGLGGGVYPIMWTRDGGLKLLTTLDRRAQAAANVSSDGTVVVGGGQFGAWRWTETGGMASLTPSGAERTMSFASAMLDGGSVIVGGTASDKDAGLAALPVILDSSGLRVFDFADFDMRAGIFRGGTADGSQIFGTGYFGEEEESRGYLWSEDSDLELLPENSDISYITDDGAYAAGSLDGIATYWDSEGNPRKITEGRFTWIADDASFGFIGGKQPRLWINGQGIRGLINVLNDAIENDIPNGVLNQPFATIFEVEAVSADGQQFTVRGDVLFSGEKASAIVTLPDSPVVPEPAGALVLLAGGAAVLRRR